MEVVITGRQMEVRPALRRYIEQRAQKAARYATTVGQIVVILKTEKYRHHAEVLARIDGRLLRTEAETEEMNSAVDAAIDKLETRLQRHQERRRNLRTEKSRTIRKTETPSPTSNVQTRRVQKMSPMTLLAAEAKIEGVKEGFLLFLDPESGGVCLLYRDIKGNLGLIEGTPGTPSASRPASRRSP